VAWERVVLALALRAALERNADALRAEGSFSVRLDGVPWPDGRPAPPDGAVSVESGFALALDPLSSPPPSLDLRLDGLRLESPWLAGRGRLHLSLDDPALLPSSPGRAEASLDLTVADLSVLGLSNTAPPLEVSFAAAGPLAALESSVALSCPAITAGSETMTDFTAGLNILPFPLAALFPSAGSAGTALSGSLNAGLRFREESAALSGLWRLDLATPDLSLENLDFRAPWGRVSGSLGVRPAHPGDAARSLPEPHGSLHAAIPDMAALGAVSGLPFRSGNLTLDMRFVPEAPFPSLRADLSAAGLILADPSADADAPPLV
jgi:hypothetical protein